MKSEREDFSFKALRGVVSFKTAAKGDETKLNRDKIKERNVIGQC